MNTHNVDTKIRDLSLVSDLLHKFHATDRHFVAAVTQNCVVSVSPHRQNTFVFIFREP
jgi:hypothetical protein